VVGVANAVWQPSKIMIIQDDDIFTYIAGAMGAALPTGIQNLVRGLHSTVENLVKDFVGYEIEQTTVTELHPTKIKNTRYDGDWTAQGFDLYGGTVVARSTFPQQNRCLVLLQLPVRSIVSVNDNPAAYNTSPPTFDGSSLLPTNAYYFDDPGNGICWSGILFRNIGSWGVTFRTIQVVYVAGLTPTELQTRFTEFGFAIKVSCAFVVMNAVARARMVRQGQLAKSVSIEDFSATFGGWNDGLIGSLLGSGLPCSDLPTEAKMILQRCVHPGAYA
jgi:hypothetical protein